MEEAEDEPLFAERVAGIDIAKAEVMVTVRVPSDTRPGGRQQETRWFRTIRRDLLALADWLRTWGVTKAGMEATGDYWKPVYFLLEREGFDCDLYHAGQVKALPGRPKTDKLDSAWLAKITERGSLPSSFVPPEPVRRLRTHTRYRRHLTQARTAEKQRVEKLLEDAHLKLSSVISDIHGVSGRDMLEAIIAGERNPKVLAQLARRRMRRKISELEQALDCSFVSDEHALVLKMMLATIDHLTAQIDELTAKINVLCEPYRHQIGQLCTTPGTDVITAQDIIGEIGVDMTVFPTAAHLASWTRARPPSAPAAPRPSWAPSTGGSSGTCPRRKPRSLSEDLSSPSTTPCFLTPAPPTPTLAPATTSSACTSAARPATTSAPWNASATRSPSSPSTLTPASSRPQPGNHHHRHPEPVSAAAPPGAAARPAGLLFSDQPERCRSAVPEHPENVE